MAADSNDTVSVLGLPAGISSEEVHDIFEAYGPVAQALAVPCKARGCLASAVVKFKHAVDADWVVKALDGNIAEGLLDPVEVKFAECEDALAAKEREDTADAAFGAELAEHQDAAAVVWGDIADTAIEGRLAGDQDAAAVALKLEDADAASPVEVQCEDTAAVELGEAARAAARVRFGGQRAAAAAVWGGLADSALEARFADLGDVAAVKLQEWEDQEWEDQNADRIQGPATPDQAAADSAAQLGGVAVSNPGVPPPPPAPPRPGPAVPGARAPRSNRSGSDGAARGAPDNVFVGNLPLGYTKQQVAALFSSCGKIVNCAAIRPKTTNMQWSVGLVKFADPRDAEWVVNNMNGTTPAGLDVPIKVEFATKQHTGRPAPASAPADVPAQAPTPAHPPAGPASGSERLFVSGLPVDATSEQVEALFAQYGEVTWCQVLVSRKVGPSSALVRYADKETAAWVVDKVNGTVPDGLHWSVTVRHAIEKHSAPEQAPQQESLLRPTNKLLATKREASSENQERPPWKQHQVREEARPAGASGAHPPGGQPAANPVFVRGLPADISADRVKTLFCKYGIIVGCHARPTLGDEATRAAVLRFANQATAEWVVKNVNGTSLPGVEGTVSLGFEDEAQLPGTEVSAPLVCADAVAQRGGPGGKFGGGDAARSFRSAPYRSDTSSGKGAGKAAKGLNLPTCSMASVLAAAKTKQPRSPPSADGCAVCVRNLPEDASDVSLYRLFSPFGAIAPERVKAERQGATGRADGVCNGTGHVDFRDRQSAEAAAEALHGLALPDGTALVVRIKRPRRAADQDAVVS